jgi:CheY-like chemotaxis protein
MLVELQGGKIHLQSKRNVGTALRFFVTVKRSAAVPLPVPPDEMHSMSTKTVSASTARYTVADDDIRRMHVLVVEVRTLAHSQQSFLRDADPGPPGQHDQRLLAKLLANLGCTTRTCSNGQECVDLLVSLAQAESSEDTRFDLVLMDLEMCVLSCAFDFYPLMSRRPVLDGLGATQRIRELEAQGMLKYVVPVVAVSGNARSEWTVRINSSVATLCSCSSHQDHAREAGMNDFVRKPYSKAELDTLLTQWRPAAASMKSRLSVT